MTKGQIISTGKRLEYARGYTALGLFREAGSELEQIAVHDQGSIEVQSVWVDLYMAAQKWKDVLKIARLVCETAPEKEGAWIAWAQALRKMDRIKEAECVLLKAEPFHGAKSAVLHYHLACYACLQGDHIEADRRVSKACKLDESYSEKSLNEPDLRGMMPF